MLDLCPFESILVYLYLEVIDIFIILIMVVVSWVITHVETQIVHLK